MAPRTLLALLTLAASTAGLAACKTECEEVNGPLGPGAGAGEFEDLELAGTAWRRHTVDASACGPAYVTLTDVTNDGALDMVWSRLGERAGLKIPSGEVTLYTRDGDGLGEWSRAPILPHAAGIHFPAQTTLVDLDGDADLDALVPSGFLVCEVVPFADACGGMLWYEQDGESWVRHTIVAPRNDRFFHVALLADLDGDGVDDLISVGETYDPGEAEVMWWPGTGDGAEPFEPTPRRIGFGLGALTRLGDVDGDGDLDLYGAQYFKGGASFAWFEQVAAPAGGDAGTWEYHIIDDTSGKSFELHIVPDLRGDGKRYAVGTNHTNTSENEGDVASAVLLFTIPDDPRQPWPKEVISTGIVSREGRGAGAPGLLNTGDIDGDGDIDLLVAGDGDPRVFFYEQTDGGAFTQHVLLDGVGQAGGLGIADIDGDADLDFVVSGYEANTIFLFERR